MDICAGLCCQHHHQWLIKKRDVVKQAPLKATMNEKIGSSKL